MFEEAFRLAADNQDRAEAARRYVESARLRPCGDLKVHGALYRAGEIYDHLGKK